MRHVIVGAGVCGTAAAEEIRKIDADAEITLIGEEEHALYSRVILPLYALEKVPREKCFLKKDGWYDEKNIEYLRGRRVVSIDTKNKHVELDDARELPYDRLMIATGGDAREAPFELRGVSYFQTLNDTDQLVQLLGEQRKNEKKQAVIYGGGFISCEYLNVFEKFGYDITVVHRGPHFWSRVLDEESGRLMREHLESHGVRVIASKHVTDLVGEDVLTGVMVDDEEIPAQILGVGVGLVRDISHITDSGIDADKGILVDEFLRTSAEDVYAGGDVVEYQDLVTGWRVMAGNYTNAMAQGRLAGKNMTGQENSFRLVSSYAIAVMGLDVIFVGDAQRDKADEIVVRGSVDSGVMEQIFMKDGRVFAATLLGSNKNRMTITKLIDSQMQIDKEKLEDPDFDLKTLLA